MITLQFCTFPSLVGHLIAWFSHGAVNHVDAVTDTFPVNTTLTVTGVITAVANGAPVDPSDVSLYVVDPYGSQTSYTLSAQQVIRTSPGNYSYDLVPATPGVWQYWWQGTGAVVVSMFKSDFVVV